MQGTDKRQEAKLCRDTYPKQGLILSSPFGLLHLNPRMSINQYKIVWLLVYFGCYICWRFYVFITYCIFNDYLWAELLRCRINWKLGLWQCKRLVIWSANAVAEEQIGKGLGWVPGNAVLGDRDPPYPETDSCCMKGAENLGKYTLPVLDRGLSFPWQAEEFCEEDKHCPSHSSLSAVSSSWHDKIPKQGYWECIIQKCSVVWVEKRGNIRCCFSNKDPVSCLTPQR